MRFAARDLTGQFISSSYQDVVQRYNDGNFEHFLDGYGNVVFFFPSASYGSQILTINDTASYSISSSYALTSSYETYVDISSSYSDTSSYSFFAETASYVDANNISNLYLPFEFTYKSTTSTTDPGAGNFNYDSFTSSSIANIIIDKQSANGLDLSTIFAKIRVGHQIYIQQKTDATKAALFTVTTAIIDNGGWFTLPVSLDTFGDGYPTNNKISLFAVINNTTLVSGSSYPITSSWAINSETSSYLNGLNFNSTSSNISISSNVVMSIFSGSYEHAWFDVGIRSGSNQRACNIIATWQGNAIKYTEYSTTDIGNTNDVTMSVDVSGSNIRLLSTVNSSNNWNIKAFGRYL